MPEEKKQWPAKLGDTVEEIAESLRKQGARGIPGDCRNCIIARSYKLNSPNGWSGLHASFERRPAYPKTDPETYTYFTHLTFDDCQIMDPTGSAALGEFMHRFDQGEYPDLITGAIPTKEAVLATLTTEQQIAIGS